MHNRTCVCCTVKTNTRDVNQKLSREVLAFSLCLPPTHTHPRRSSPTQETRHRYCVCPHCQRTTLQHVRVHVLVQLHLPVVQKMMHPLGWSARERGGGRLQKYPFTSSAASTTSTLYLVVRAYSPQIRPHHLPHQFSYSYRGEPALGSARPNTFCAFFQSRRKRKPSRNESG